jgi:hypothetical protein
MKKNLAIINCAIITGILVVVFFAIYQFTVIKSGWNLLINAALVLTYTLLIFFCKPKPKRL